MSELSYAEALVGVVGADEMDGIVGLVEAHKNWGAFRVKNLNSHTVVNLVDEIKRLRQITGGYKTLPKGADALDLVDDSENE